jgi:hypothetical protein
MNARNQEAQNGSENLRRVTSHAVRIEREPGPQIWASVPQCFTHNLGSTRVVYVEHYTW